MSCWEVENATTEDEVQKREEELIEKFIGCEVEASSI